MIAAAVTGVILAHTASPVLVGIPDPLMRRVLAGTAMGITAVCLLYSPWGKQSGAHMNPSVTLAFYRLGKVRREDAISYIGFQFTGGPAGLVLAWVFLGDLLAHPEVNDAMTAPGPARWGVALLAAFIIAFILMTMVLWVTNTPSLARLTGFFAGFLIALYVIVVEPLSAVSMNPARTFASALLASRWDVLWIYCMAPPLAMLLAAEAFSRMRSGPKTGCAKLDHEKRARCIHCGARRAALGADDAPVKQNNPHGTSNLP